MKIKKKKQNVLLLFLLSFGLSLTATVFANVISNYCHKK